MANARHTRVFVSFDGMDISGIINKYLMSLSYTDNEEDEADDLQIKLEDRGGIWLQKWLQDTIDSGSKAFGGETTGEQRYIKVDDKTTGFRSTVSKGTSNYDAATCQIYLQALGFLTSGIVIKANADTVAAIKAFQRHNSIGTTGKCDRKTWSRLISAINGMTIPLYDCEAKATKKITLRKAPRSSAKKVTDISNGKICVITGKVSRSWYAVEYKGKFGYATGRGLKLSGIWPSFGDASTGKLKGLNITASITAIGTDGKQVTTDCGSFELDDIKASGPPSTVTIKATSLGYHGIRKTENSKSWEVITLSEIAGIIAEKYGLGTLFDFAVDKRYERVEQARETDIAFLKRLCQECGYSLKITNNQIVIFDQLKYESLPVVAVFTFGDGSYTKWSLSTGSGQTEYDVCEVSYTNPSTGRVIKATAYTEEYKAKLEAEKEKKSSRKKSDSDEAETLRITNRKVDTVKEAEDLAAQMLKLKNKFEREVTLTTKGNPLLCAGMAVMLNGFGYWNGKYMIFRAKHDVSGSNGYVTTITLRKIEPVAGPAEYVPKRGDTVRFLGGSQYKTSRSAKPSGGARKAGKAKIMKIADLTHLHPYKLQGGKYNKLSGKSNVNAYVNRDEFK